MVRVRPMVWWAEGRGWVPLADVEYRAPPVGVVVPAEVRAADTVPWGWGEPMQVQHQQWRACEDVGSSSVVGRCDQLCYYEEGCGQGWSVSI